MQHLQHNFKVNYWFNIKLCEDIRISKRIDKETNLQTKFIIKRSASGPKVTTKSTFVSLTSNELHLQLNKFLELRYKKNLFGL